MAAVLLAAGLVLGACASDSDEPQSGPADDGPEGTQIVRANTRNHVDGELDYPTSPPAGGDHNQVWQNCGFYEEPVIDEHAVHALEHGAVWIAYDPAISDVDLGALSSLSAGEPFLLVSPYEGLESPIVLTAWGRQLALDSLDLDTIAEFIDAYAEGGSAPEPGAPCDGGTSETA
jgi:hypothetical protein